MCCAIFWDFARRDYGKLPFARQRMGETRKFFFSVPFNDYNDILYKICLADQKNQIVVWQGV
jgi:hypothetical protein